MAVKLKILGAGGDDALTEVTAASVTAAAHIEIADSGLTAPKSRRLQIANAIQAAFRLLSTPQRDFIMEVLNCPTACEGSPQNAVHGRPGRHCWDTVNKRQYVKDTGDGTNTGWREIIA